MKKTWNWIIGVIGLGMVGGGGYYMHTQTEKTKPPSTSSPSISISSVNAKPLVFSMGTNYVDLPFIGTASKGKERNLVDPAFISLNKNLGFTRGAWISIGSISQYGHVNLFNTGIGYNMVKSDFVSDADYKSYGDGVATQKWTSDFNNDIAAFKNQLGVPCDLVLNIKNGTWTEFKTLINQFNPEYVELGAELVTSSLTVDQYMALANPIIDSLNKNFPSIKIVIDCGLVYRGNQKTLDWNKNVASMKGQYGRWYLQLGDREDFNMNQDSNVIKINNYFSSGVEVDLASFSKSFPTWKMFAGEVLLEDNRGGAMYINNSITGVYAWSKIYEFLFTKQDTIPVGYQMSVKNLVGTNDPTNVNYVALKVLNKLQGKTKSITTLTLNSMAGVTGISEVDGKTTTVLLNNSTKIAFTPTLTIDGKNKTGTFILQRQYSSDGTWNGKIVADSVSQSTISVPACGFTLITYTNK